MKHDKKTVDDAINAGVKHLTTLKTKREMTDASLGMIALMTSVLHQSIGKEKAQQFLREIGERPGINVQLVQMITKSH